MGTPPTSNAVSVPTLYHKAKVTLPERSVSEPLVEGCCVCKSTLSGISAPPASSDLATNISAILPRDVPSTTQFARSKRWPSQQSSRTASESTRSPLSNQSSAICHVGAGANGRRCCSLSRRAHRVILPPCELSTNTSHPPPGSQTRLMSSKGTPSKDGQVTPLWNFRPNATKGISSATSSSEFEVTAAVFETTISSTLP
mmetsp:Transcript_119168/g.344705  ORF Transcript_119168/g.344705 Transcript_119168/m.344705 type:complete len:200 (-) Transcript_119168:2085-2684(-)